MELRTYFRILLKKWWVVLPTFLVTFVATAVLTFTQAPTYRTTATYIVSPNTSFETAGSFVSVLDTLSRRSEIATTYSEVAMSRSVRQAAADVLDLSPDQRKGLSVESRLRAGTNVMEIVVEGNDPVVVSEFANMVGTKTIAYVTKLYEAFDMIPLDQALRPTSIIRPNRIMNLIFGAIFGMALGAGLAFLADYLQAPPESAASPGILDDESGAYNRNYFTQRLREEMSRASRNNYPLSVALMDVDQLKVLSTSLSPEMRSEALRKMAVFLKQYLREEDVMARLDETVFAFLLPDISEEEAKATMEKLQTRIAWTPFEIGRSGVRLNLSGATGVVAYDHNGMGPNELIAQASRALQQAEGAGYGKVRSFQESFPEGEKGD